MVYDAMKTFKKAACTIFNNKDNRAKIQDADFVVGLVYAKAHVGKNFSLSMLRTTVCSFLDKSIGSSAFNERLTTKSLTMSLHKIFLYLLSKVILQKTNFEQDILKKTGVCKIIGVDSSIVSLWDGLSAFLPGSFTTAALKMHFCIDLITGAMEYFNFTPGATHDSQWFPQLMKGYLYIVDLGYWSTTLLKEISSSGAFFLTRIKATTKMTITSVVSGAGIKAIGCDLLSYSFKKGLEVIEIMATFNQDGKKANPYRVIGVWNAKSKKYNWYVTNLTCHVSYIYPLYRARWQIELAFKTMKSMLSFDTIPSTNINTVLSLSYATLINYLLVTMVSQGANHHLEIAPASQDVSEEITDTEKTSHKKKEEKKQKSKNFNKNRQNPNPRLSNQKASIIYKNIASNILKPVLLGRRITKNILNNISKKISSVIKNWVQPNWKSNQTSFQQLHCA